MQNWCTENAFIGSPLAETLIIDDFYETLVSGEYDRRFHNTLFRQVIHWHHLQLTEEQILVLLNRIWQALMACSAAPASPRLQRALSLVVEITRILAVKIHHFNRKLLSIRRRSQYEIARIHQAFSLLSANLPDDLVQAYIDHQEWLHGSISLILGFQQEPGAGIPASHACNLARWLEQGGQALIPEEQFPEFDAAHRKVHELATTIQKNVSLQDTSEIFSLLSELENASQVVGTTLLRCIDESITQFASYDPLTRLRNRSTLQAYFEKEMALARRFGKQAGVILLDIDHFKKINDEYGHLFGDQILVELAQCLSRQIRQDDALFRWGGEEFLILGLTDTRPENSIAALAERTRHVVGNTVFCTDTDTPIQFTISAGVVEFLPGRHLPPMDAIFNQADKLLYQAKQAGRNQVVSEFLKTP